MLEPTENPLADEHSTHETLTTPAEQMDSTPDSTTENSPAKDCSGEVKEQVEDEEVNPLNGKTRGSTFSSTSDKALTTSTSMVDSPPAEKMESASQNANNRAEDVVLDANDTGSVPPSGEVKTTVGITESTPNEIQVQEQEPDPSNANNRAEVDASKVNEPGKAEVTVTLDLTSWLICWMNAVFLATFKAHDDARNLLDLMTSSQKTEDAKKKFLDYLRDNHEAHNMEHKVATLLLGRMQEEPRPADEVDGILQCFAIEEERDLREELLLFFLDSIRDDTDRGEFAKLFCWTTVTDYQEAQDELGLQISEPQILGAVLQSFDHQMSDTEKMLFVYSALHSQLESARKWEKAVNKLYEDSKQLLKEVTTITAGPSYVHDRTNIYSSFPG
ncbi:hypothetical protein DFH07DRAFT_947750 [Mycena maculata]|uniref:Uncharacterized protein n=1 Tax=Mycena maculata TaxID=230809 RepID=A0AAD7H957_9AGAR|nr:hypothetical protein DFH07DRAFT_947750 [Mycena maculata]